MVKLSVVHPSTLLTIFFSYLCLASLVFASVLDVYAPPVVDPAAGVVWQVGQFYNVTWDISSPPRQITNSKGHIQLRKGDVTLPMILASEFSILLGSITVQVPPVTPGDDYRVVLFGDSGNWSQQFTIKSQ